MPDDLSTDAIEPEEARRLYQYWVARKGTRTFAGRADIDPLDLGFALGRVSLIDELTGPRRYRFRLLGTEPTDQLGFEMTGKYLDQLPRPELRGYLETLFARTVASRAPTFEIATDILDQRKWSHETLVLPLASDGDTIDMLLVWVKTEALQDLADHPRKWSPRRRF